MELAVAAFIIALIVGLPVGILNQVIYYRSAGRNDEGAKTSLLGKSIAARILLVSLAGICLYYFFHVSAYLLNPPREVICAYRLSSAGYIIPPLVKEMNRYPEDMAELLREAESRELVRSGEFEELLICPYNKTKEISYEYFPPDNLKPDVEKFVLLYEKPNNHSHGREDRRTVLYSDGSVYRALESELHEQLLAQSKDPDGFVWEPSSYEDSRQDHGDGWWKADAAKKTRPRAILITGFFLLLFAIALFI